MARSSWSGHRPFQVWQDDCVPTPPPPDVVALHDHSPDEIESPEELLFHLSTGSLATKIVQGLDLSAVDLSAVDVQDTLFIGCHFAALDADRRPVAAAGGGGPRVHRRAVSDAPVAALRAGRPRRRVRLRRVRRHVRHAWSMSTSARHGGATPEIREAIAQRMHDSGIDNALANVHRRLDRRPAAGRGGRDHGRARRAARRGRLPRRRRAGVAAGPAPTAWS